MLPSGCRPADSVEVPAAALIFRASGTQVAQGRCRQQDQICNSHDRARQRQLGRVGLGREARRSAGAEHQQPNCVRPDGRRRRIRCGQQIAVCEALRAAGERYAIIIRCAGRGSDRLRGRPELSHPKIRCAAELRCARRRHCRSAERSHGGFGDVVARLERRGTQFPGRAGGQVEPGPEDCSGPLAAGADLRGGGRRTCAAGSRCQRGRGAGDRIRSYTRPGRAGFGVGR